MSDGTSLATVKAALLQVLAARAGLAGVAITDGGPVSASDLQNDDGAYEAIWLGDATAPEIDIPHLGVPVTFDETYDLDVVVQVLKVASDPDSAEITQAVADARCAALLGEVLGAVVNDPSLGIASSTTNPFVDVIPAGWSHHGGWLGKGSERGSRFVLKLRAEARISIT